MTKKEFQTLNGFADEEMDKLSECIKTFNGMVTNVFPSNWDGWIKQRRTHGA